MDDTDNQDNRIENNDNNVDDNIDIEDDDSDDEEGGYHFFDENHYNYGKLDTIEKLKEIGCTSCQLGQKSTYLSDPNLTDKELSISYFKEGFAGYVYAQPHLEVNI